MVVTRYGRHAPAIPRLHARGVSSIIHGQRYPGGRGPVLVTAYLVRRVSQAIPLLLVISIALFGLLHLIPGGPEQVAFSPPMSPQARHDMVVALALDHPLPIQYAKWLWGT